VRCLGREGKSGRRHLTTQLRWEGTTASRGGPPDESAVTETLSLRSGLDCRADSFRPSRFGKRRPFWPRRGAGSGLASGLTRLKRYLKGLLRLC